jgi:malonate decarboxylase beta subunit
MMSRINSSFVELKARERAKAVLDAGTFRELLGPFDRIESPHLAAQDIVPASDDGMIVARGLIAGEPAVVIAMEGAFQGGGIGEVAGAKLAGALEQALEDHKKGIPTRPVILLDTGGVRLQEANYGLLAISEIQSAVIALREYVPIVGVIPGKIGCFGGMSMTAGLFSTLIMTREGRLTLNGPEVIEQEAGVLEFDAKDKILIWNTLGGVQRCATGIADVLVEDDIEEICTAVKAAFAEKPAEPRSRKIELFLSRLAAIHPAEPLAPSTLRELWGKGAEPNSNAPLGQEEGLSQTESRGRSWFAALTGDTRAAGKAASVLCKDALFAGEEVRILAVVPNEHSRFPRARHGEVGLEEGWTLAKYVREAILADADKERRRPIIAIVDVPSQAYGYKEELLGLHQSCAAAVDAYATARFLGHPVIALVVGNAISGAFLSHGYQANQIIALNDPGVLVHAMSKQSAARVTKRSVSELEAAAKIVPGIAYDIGSYATLGVLYELLEGITADAPTGQDIVTIEKTILGAIEAARTAPKDLSSRLSSAEAKVTRKASITVRDRLGEQWA